MCATVCPSQALAYVTAEQIAASGASGPTNVFQFGPQVVTTKVFMVAPPGTRVAVDVVDYMWEERCMKSSRARERRRPLWREEFAIHAARRALRQPPPVREVPGPDQPRDVRRQRLDPACARLRREPGLPARAIAEAARSAVGGVKLFRYPGRRTTPASWCARRDGRATWPTARSARTSPARSTTRTRRTGLECPCHEGLLGAGRPRPAGPAAAAAAADRAGGAGRRALGRGLGPAGSSLMQPPPRQRRRALAGVDRAIALIACC